jgi:hypothetical protein
MCLECILCNFNNEHIIVYSHAACAHVCVSLSLCVCVCVPVCVWNRN